MAERKESLILEVEIDRSGAETELDKVEKSLLAAKRQQQELNKAFKEGKITEDQYIKSNRELQNQIKRESDQKRVLNNLLLAENNSRDALRARVAQLTREYNSLNPKTKEGAQRAKELQEELKGLNEQLNTGSKAAGSFKDNIGNYPQQLAEAATSANIAGTSINDLTSKFSSGNVVMAATAGIVGTLATAYASSSLGASDLAYAQSRLSATTKVLSAAFASLVSSEGDSRGLISRMVDTIIESIPAVGGVLAGLTKTIADAELLLKDLELSRAFAQGFAKEDERRAEFLRRIRDDEEESLELRLAAAEEIDGVLQRSSERTVTVLQAQIQAIKESTVGYENNREAQLAVAQLTAEIADKEEEITGKLTENVTARKAIAAEIAALNRANDRLANPTNAEVDDPLTGAFEDRLNNELDAQLRFNKRIADAQQEAAYEAIRIKRREAEARIELERRVADSQIDISTGLLAVGASMFEQQSAEYKTFATAQTLISTYAAAQKAFEAAFTPPTVASPGLAAGYVALAVAQGLANLAKIHGVQFAEGGWTGPGGKYDVAGVVHADEYVVPKAVNNSPAARPHLAALENMRLRGYADGGYVTRASTAQINQQMDVINIIKAMPPQVVDVREVTRKQNRIQVKEQLSSR